jgi:hypothetical protein
MNWRCGLSDRGSALQMQSPKFKPQSHQKKKKKRSNLQLQVICLVVHFLDLMSVMEEKENFI